MTETIFTDWLKKLNARFEIKNRKILLFLDNFGDHFPNKRKEPYNFSNIKSGRNSRLNSQKRRFK